ncbi:hypothetical protein GCM10009737_12230 [Nocardioides lentus]|uniref:DUF308 domain-containing protein n=1 Tax=Nocardioides lentus TaxID=338077 RepID=A0ABP5AF23_9ACTN
MGGVDRSREDALWRSIVENYGERARLDAPGEQRTGEPPADADPPDPAADPLAGLGPGDTLDVGPPHPGTPEDPGPGDLVDPTGPAADRAADRAADQASDGTRDRVDGDDHAAAREREAAARAREFEERHEVPDRFVPPEPPPLPYVAPRRLLAWLALVGGPLLLVLSLAVGLPLSPFWRLLAALAFVGGFVYLVVSMPREPRDPTDDGARV